MRHLGVPEYLLQAWQGFLNGVSRRFVVRNDCGEPITNCTGFPEGCPLSCAGMVVIDLCWHAYQTQYAPSSIPFSFVDNLEIVSDDVSAVLRGFVVLEEFCDVLDLSLDARKLIFWSTSTQGRQQLRIQGKAVSHGERDLGGQMSYTAAVHNQVIVKRMKGVLPFLQKLRRSGMSQRDRVQCITQGLWPRAFHGCENALIGKSHINKLRSGVMKALGWDKAGASPVASMLLADNLLLDPGFFQFWRCLKQMRTHLSRNFALRGWWQAFVGRFDGQLLPGPMSKFMQELGQVHWNIDAELQVWVTPKLSLNLVDTPAETWLRLSTYAWQQHLADSLNARDDYLGLQGVWPNCLKREGGLQSGLLRTIRNGTFYTGDKLSKFDLSLTPNCKHCGAVDSLEHRLVRCPLFADVRLEYGAWLDAWNEHNPASKYHGITSENSMQIPYWEALHQLPDETPDFYVSGPLERTLHVFTDGSCLHPTDPELALAGWACVEADTGVVFSAGLVPGIMQTINRAELMAMLSVVKWHRQFGGEVHVWSDSSYVVDGFRQLDAAGFVDDDSSNSDLWIEIHRNLPPDHALYAHKVPSHVDVWDCTSPFQEWACINNSRADAAARHAVTQLPSQLRKVRAQFLAQHDLACRITKTSQQFLLAVSSLSDKGSAMTSRREEAQEGSLRPEDAWSANPRVLSPAMRGRPLPAKIAKYGTAFVEKVFEFVERLDLNDHCAKISFLELFVCFKGAFGISAPVQIEPGRWASRDAGGAKFCFTTLASDVRIFGDVIKGILALSESDIQCCTVDLSHNFVYRLMPGVSIGFNRVIEGCVWVGCVLS